MNERISTATINVPEFINLQPLDINPLMSKGEVKVMYIGQNRNGSCITKEVATKMSKTLRGCPIVGHYIESKEDFGDHGDQVIIDGEGIKFNKLTKPYGFVSPDAKVWFQFFEDVDEFGNAVVREYLMTECYLWTGQFPECQRALENDNPQSMELDEKTLQGHWATDNNSGVEFFIISEGVFSALCILGEDVEPCFEGARVTDPDISSNFSKESTDENIRTLFKMIDELKFALNSNKGGTSMENFSQELDTTVTSDTDNLQVEVEEVVEDVVTETVEEEVVETEVETVEEPAAEEVVEEVPAEVLESAKAEEEKEEDASEDEEPAQEEVKEEEDKEEDKAATNHALELEAQLQELQTAFAAIKAENEELKAFKLGVENKQKDELIASFYMLSDEDKQDVIANKANYSLDEIESKLSVICVRQKVSFKDEVANVATTFNLGSISRQESSNKPEWLVAVDNNIAR